MSSRGSWTVVHTWAQCSRYYKSRPHELIIKHSLLHSCTHANTLQFSDYHTYIGFGFVKINDCFCLNFLCHLRLVVDDLRQDRSDNIFDRFASYTLILVLQRHKGHKNKGKKTIKLLCNYHFVNITDTQLWIDWSNLIRAPWGCYFSFPQKKSVSAARAETTMTAYEWRGQAYTVRRGCL